MNTGNVLLMTVGLGNDSFPETSLLKPMAKSLKQDPWSLVLLFPSQISLKYAETLRCTLSGLPIVVEPPLPKGAEEDVDRCFSIFSDRFATLKREGYKPAQFVVDFTRGTKAMSGGLLMAALSNGAQTARYVSGERDSANIVIPGTEKVQNFPLRQAIRRRELDLALDLMRRHQFTAALAVARNTEQNHHPGDDLEAASTIALARFYSTWDRFDYPAAALIRLDGIVPSLLSYVPSQANLTFLGELAAQEPEELPKRSRYAWLLAADLLSNAYRRVALGAAEDALVRVNRVIELMAASQLYHAGLDPENPPARGPSTSRPGKAMDHSEIVSRLQTLNANLYDYVYNQAPARYARNQSLLIHGMKASTAGIGQTGLRSRLDRLKNKLLEFGPAEMADWLGASRFPFPLPLPHKED